MHVTVLFNPISGAGRAADAGRAVAEALRNAGLGAALLPTRPPLKPTCSWLDAALNGTNLLVIVGGDGAVRMSAASALRTRIPIYHFPFGTENLFAREFGMDQSIEKLREAIDRFEVRSIDVGVCNGRTFLLMASVGFDAEVVHRLAGRRGASISHLSYVSPIVAELRRWRPVPLRVTVDGERIDNHGPGFVVVGNSKQYGWRLNPASHARMDDGVLDVAFFPARSRLDLVNWAIKCRLNRQSRSRRLVYRRGKSVAIAADVPLCYQLDGDPPGAVRELAESLDGHASDEFDRPLSLNIHLVPGALEVLLPKTDCAREGDF